VHETQLQDQNKTPASTVPWVVRSSASSSSKSGMIMTSADGERSITAVAGAGAAAVAVPPASSSAKCLARRFLRAVNEETSKRKPCWQHPKPRWHPRVGGGVRVLRCERVHATSSARFHAIPLRLFAYNCLALRVPESPSALDHFALGRCVVLFRLRPARTPTRFRVSHFAL